MIGVNILGKLEPPHPPPRVASELGIFGSDPILKKKNEAGSKSGPGLKNRSGPYKKINQFSHIVINQSCR